MNVMERIATHGVSITARTLSEEAVAGFDSQGRGIVVVGLIHEPLAGYGLRPSARLVYVGSGTGAPGETPEEVSQEVVSYDPETEFVAVVVDDTTEVPQSEILPLYRTAEEIREILAERENRACREVGCAAPGRNAVTLDASYAVFEGEGRSEFRAVTIAPGSTENYCDAHLEKLTAQLGGGIPLVINDRIEVTPGPPVAQESRAQQ